MVRILSDTPIWVFALFLALLVLGLEPVPLVSWAAGLAIAVLVGYAWFRDRRVGYDATDKKFIVALSAVYGLLSGYFGARALNLIKKAQMA